MYHVNVNVKLRKENETQIKIRRIINVDVIVKSICEKYYISNPTSCSWEMVNI